MSLALIPLLLLGVLVLYRGPYSIMQRCTHRQNGRQYAVRIIDVAKFTSRPGKSIAGLHLSISAASLPFLSFVYTPCIPQNLCSAVT